MNCLISSIIQLLLLLTVLWCRFPQFCLDLCSSHLFLDLPPLLTFYNLVSFFVKSCPLCMLGSIFNGSELMNIYSGQLCLHHQTKSSTVKATGKGSVITLNHGDITHKLTPQKTVKWLGLLINKALHWKAQIECMIDKGEDWVNKFRRIAKISRGVTATTIRDFYEAIAIPCMLYRTKAFAAPTTTTIDKQRNKIWPL